MASLEKQQPGLGTRPYLINSMPLIFKKELPMDAKHVIFTVEVESKQMLALLTIVKIFSFGTPTPFISWNISVHIVL